MNSSNLVDVLSSSTSLVEGEKQLRQPECALVIVMKNQDELAYYVRIDRIFCVITGVLFSLGLVANLWVLQRILGALKSPRYKSTSNSSPRHVFVYLAALALTDLSLLLNCPFLIHDVANMQWNFGAFLCKCLYGNESLNKLLSGFILAALSFDQLIAVRKILPNTWRTVGAAWKIIGSLTFVAVILLIPLFLYTRVITLIDEQKDAQNNLTTQAIQKCVFAPPPDMIHMTNGFMISIFVCGFCLPTFCIGVSYGTILYRFAATGYLRGAAVVGENSDIDSASSPPPPPSDRRRRSIRHRRSITWYILLLVVIYLCCWAPYWIAAVRIGFAPQYYHDSHTNQLAITYALLYIHLLPYLNAVLNAFAYGCMINFSGVSSKTTSAKQRRGGNRQKKNASRIDTSRQTNEAVTRLSLGETWSIESAPVVDRQKRTTPKKIDRKWPSAIELGSIFVN